MGEMSLKWCFEGETRAVLGCKYDRAVELAQLIYSSFSNLLKHLAIAVAQQVVRLSVVRWHRAATRQS